MKRILLLALLALTLPLLAASPEYMIGGTVAAPAPNWRGDAEVATDGTDFLVAWTDFRAGSTRSVIATRVTRSGEVLDPLGIRILPTTGNLLRVEVAWNGDSYLVVWTAGTLQNDSVRYDIYAARLDRDGKLVMQPRVLVERSLLTEYHAMGANGNVAVVSYYNDQPPYGVWIASVGHNGDVLHREALGVSSGMGGFAIAAIDSQFLLTWSENEGQAPFTIRAQALTGDGHLTGDRVVLGPGNATAIATDGSRFLVVSSGNAVEARLLDASLKQIGDTVTITTDTSVSPSMTAVWHSGHYEVNYGSYGGLTAATAFIAEIDAGGRLVASRERDKPGFASAATNGNDLLLIYDAAVTTSAFPKLFAALYHGRAAAADDEELLAWSGNAHKNPVVAAGAQGHLVAWDEESGVYFTRVDAQGNSLDGRGVLIAAKGFGVRVAFDGTNYVAAWVEENGLGVRRIAPATGATVAEVHVTTEVWNGLAVTASPNATFVAWASERLFVTRIPHATNVADAVPAALSPADTNVTSPAAAWNGSELLVTWNEFDWSRGDPPFPLAEKVLASRLTATLGVLDSEPLLVGELDASARRDGRSFGPPTIASDGHGWLIAANLGNWLGQNEVLARRVQSTGALEGSAIERIANGETPAVTWDGARYVIAWKDGDIVRLGALSASGTPAITRQTVVATDAAPSLLSIAPAANGEAAVTYTRLSLLPQHAGVERTFLRFLDSGQPRGRALRR